MKALIKDSKIVCLSETCPPNCPNSNKCMSIASYDIKTIKNIIGYTTSRLQKDTLKQGT